MTVMIVADSRAIDLMKIWQGAGHLTFLLTASKPFAFLPSPSVMIVADDDHRLAILMHGLNTGKSKSVVFDFKRYPKFLSMTKCRKFLGHFKVTANFSPWEYTMLLTKGGTKQQKPGLPFLGFGRSLWSRVLKSGKRKRQHWGIRSHQDGFCAVHVRSNWLNWKGNDN